MGFESYHPTIELLYFLSVFGGTLAFRHPVYLALSFLCGFAYAVKRRGLHGLFLGLGTLPLALAFALFYASYNHFGLTILGKNWIGNDLTLESFLYGLSLGATIGAIILWFSCLHSVFTTDKVVYLFGRISPKLSLFLAILLRMVPRIGVQAKKISIAQKAIGRGPGQGKLFWRVRNWFRRFSILVTWTIEDFTIVSDSMRCRGYTLRGRRAFSIYRFDNRDRSLVIAMSLGLTLLLMAVLFHQTAMQFSPRLILNPITPLSYVFYGAYGLFCLLPLGLELWSEASFRRLRRETTT